MSRHDSAALVGQTIAGKFVIESLIAVGGSGTVFRARQPALDRTVALKVLREEFSRHQGFIERFKREARAASRLEHPNSVRVLDFGQDGDSLIYLAMEYVKGRNLYQVIREDWPLSDERIVDILSQVLSAVGVAHEMGVIHRDLKPENVIIIEAKGDDGETAEVAKVCDFGIATLGSHMMDDHGPAVEGPRMTARGALVGTPQYMSPEQARGEPADRRGDVYSAGVVLYQMLTRRLPFDGESALMVAVKHVTEAPTPPSRLARVNPRLEAVCLKALSKTPEERFSSAREMRVALRSALMSATGTVTPPAPAVGAGSSGPTSTPLGIDTLAAAAFGPAIRDPRWRRSMVVVGVALGVLLTGALLSRSWLGVGGQGAVPADVVAVAPPSSSPRAAVARLPEDPAGARPAKEPAAAALVEAPTAALAEGSSFAGSAPAPSPAGVRRSRASVFRSKAEARRALAAAQATGQSGETSSRASARTAVAATVDARPPPASAQASPPSSATARPAQVARPADVEHATISIGGITTSSAIPGSNIRAAITRTPIVRCYRDALRAHGSAAAGTATLNLKIDSAGYVTSATLKDAGFLPGVKPCVERVARAAKVRDVDTGEAVADLTLNFVCPS